MNAPILLWLRRDLRLTDHPALRAACDSGRAVIPVFIDDPINQGLGAAPRMRLGMAIDHMAQQLAARGSRLILRRGAALPVLRALIAQTGADTVLWSRLYDPEARARDTEVKAALKQDGIAARSFAGHVLFEPWDVATKQGGFFKVYSPFWRAVQARDVAAPDPAPGQITAPAQWPASENLSDWQMAAPMRRGAQVVAPHCVVGEGAAQDRLDAFIEERLATYHNQRDFPAQPGTSGLSENLAYGEISPRQIWAAGRRALELGNPGAETFLKELVWREFAYHLVYHTPHVTQSCWRPEWQDFPWETGPSEALLRWQQGRTGVPFVDAAMRQLWVTGVMHNRARMIVGSYLTKHLLTDWRAGQAWFADQLIDWDPAANAMGWQWIAGCGPDAAPYFRVFNPDTQAKKFDPDGVYLRTYLTTGEPPSARALSFFDAVPRAWGLSPSDPPAQPLVSLAEGRARALAAYSAARADRDKNPVEG